MKSRNKLRSLEIIMASIEPRYSKDKKTGKRTVRYKVKIRLKDFPYEEATFDRKTDAEIWAAKRQYELRHQQYFGVQAHKTKTINDLFSRYSEALKLSNPKRYKDVMPIIKIWTYRIGHIKLSGLSKDIIMQERERLQKRNVKNDPKRPTVSNAAVNRTVAVLKRALNVAVDEWGWISHSPLSGVKSLPEPKGRTRFLQGDELDRLLTATRISENSALLAIVVLALTTGARRGEIQNIRLKDINFDKKQILLPVTKNGSPRVLHLQGYALDLVKSLYEASSPKQIYLFASPNDLENKNDFRTAWRSAIRKAGIEDFKFHDLRHSAASFLALNGAGLHQIAEILGHSSLHVTKRYTHLLESQTAGLVENMAARIFGNGKTGLAETG